MDLFYSKECKQNQENMHRMPSSIIGDTHNYGIIIIYFRESLLDKKIHIRVIGQYLRVIWRLGVRCFNFNTLIAIGSTNFS